MKITKLSKVAVALGVLMTSSVMATDESDLSIGVKYDANLDVVSVNKSLVDSSMISGATSIRYKNYAASGMSQIYGPQSNDYSYSGGGCMKATAPTAYLGLDEMLDLPMTPSNGSKIVSMSLLANPASSADTLTAILYTADENGTFDDLARTTISDAGISSHTEQGIFLDYTLEYTKSIMARLEQGGNTGEVCAIRIGYISYDVADDVLFASNFQK